MTTTPDPGSPLVTAQIDQGQTATRDQLAAHSLELLAWAEATTFRDLIDQAALALDGGQVPVLVAITVNGGQAVALALTASRPDPESTP